MESLKKFRETLKYTMEEFAKSIDVSISLYQKVETGARKPSRAFTEKLITKYPQFDVNTLYKT